LIAEKAGRDELLRQRDIAIGERNELMRQRDIALGERNELLAVSFQQIVHPVLTEETEVAEASDSEGKPDEHA